MSRLTRCSAALHSAGARQRPTRSTAVAYALATFAAPGTLQRPVRGFKGYRFWAGSFPIFLVALVVALRSRRSKPRYRVTPKVHGTPSLGLRLAFVSPQLAVLLGIAIAVP